MFRHFVCQFLSRTPTLSEEIYESLLEKAKAEGYDVSLLKKTPQPEGIALEEPSKTPSDRVGFWWLKALVGK